MSELSEYYKNEMLAAIHETALGLHEADVLNKMTMRVFDEMCLTLVEKLTPEQIRQIRPHEQVSQWERGERHRMGLPSNYLRLSRGKDCRR